MDYSNEITESLRLELAVHYLPFFAGIVDHLQLIVSGWLNRDDTVITLLAVEVYNEFKTGGFAIPDASPSIWIR